MEIGTWTGSRAEQMIEAAKEFNPANQINYYGFDLFEELTLKTFSQEFSKQPPRMEEVKKELEKTGANIYLYKGDSRQTLPEVFSRLPKMDFIFIDGGHSLETVKNDWRWSSKLLAPQGVIIFDDYWQNRTDAGAKVTVDGIDRNQFSVELLPIIDRFNNPDFGKLVIQFARVTKRNPAKGGVASD